MMWIIDECKLYGDSIKNTLQERYIHIYILHELSYINFFFFSDFLRREVLLTRHRAALKASVESFESSLPIYCFILDYFNSERITLTNCLAQYVIQPPAKEKELSLPFYHV